MGYLDQAIRPFVLIITEMMLRHLKYKMEIKIKINYCLPYRLWEAITKIWR